MTNLNHTLQRAVSFLNSSEVLFMKYNLGTKAPSAQIDRSKATNKIDSSSALTQSSLKISDILPSAVQEGKSGPSPQMA